MTCVRVLPLLFLLMTSVGAYAQTDFVATSAKVDPVMQPKQPGDVFKECANNQACSEGEEGHFTIQLPQGYVYCRASIRTVSVVPATGDRASLMSATTNERGVGIYTWTPKQGVGQRRSWVEADYTVYGVKSDLAEKYRTESKCKPPGKNIINCRGATGVNHGLPACGSVDD